MLRNLRPASKSRELPLHSHLRCLPVRLEPMPLPTVDRAPPQGNTPSAKWPGICTGLQKKYTIRSRRYRCRCPCAFSSSSFEKKATPRPQRKPPDLIQTWLIRFMYYFFSLIDLFHCRAAGIPSKYKTRLPKLVNSFRDLQETI